RQKHLNRFYSIFAPRPFGQLRVPRFLPALEQTNSKEETRLHKFRQNTPNWARVKKILENIFATVGR
ncbi:MAG: hypothetical protein ABSG82_09795, partial [Sedimentisphaerales bacterium]